MPDVSAFAQIAEAIKPVFDATFAPEGFVLTFDNLHPALGRKRAYAGIAPATDRMRPGAAVVQETLVEIRLYLKWKEEINPETTIDPRVIAGYAERLRNALRAARTTDPGTGLVWYFDVTNVDYPDDPTGNKTRFHATIRAYGNNSGLVETTG